MAKMYYEKDCELSYLNGKKIAIIGYGSQGHAHALNLKDSGCDVCVGLRAGSKNWAEAEKAGLAVKTVAEAAQWGDIVMMLINDEVQAEVYKNDIAPYLTEGKALAFAHGFNIRYQQIVPPAGVDVFMAAPKGPGHTVRSTYVNGKGVPWHRRRPGRRDGDHLPRRDRDRPVWRADRPVRRRGGSDALRL